MVRAGNIMPGEQSEALRALELLEDYHAKLTLPQDRELRAAIERVISIFKNSLMQALLDLHKFYEDTLSNDRKSVDQKTYETQQVAARLENNPPLHVGGRSLQDVQPVLPYIDGAAKNGHGLSPIRPSTLTSSSYQTTTPSYKPSYALNGSAVSGGDSRYEVEDIVLEKGTSGLGFSIAGGSDNPHIGNDPSIFVTKIIPGGAAASDGRMRKDDIILRVNQTDTVNVEHSVAVDALKHAGNVVSLRLKRQVGGDGDDYGVQQQQQHQSSYSSVPPPAVPAWKASAPTTPSSQYVTQTPQTTYHPQGQVHQIELFKGQKGLGFSIAGGVGNEHVPGDTGIFVTKIIDGGAAQMDGRLQIGDKLLSVGNVHLENVTHEHAVETLKATAARVPLTFIKNPHPEQTATMLNQSAEQQPFSYTQPPLGQRATTPQYYTTPYQVPPRPASAQHFEQQGQWPQTPQTPGIAQMQGAMSHVPRQPRVVNLNKGPQGLGFNIVGGEDNEGIFISYIMPGGVADLSGAIHRGDQLLEVNGVNLRGASHEQAAMALKQSGQQCSLLMQYRPEDFDRFEARIEALRDQMISGQVPQPSPRREIFVRALFDYDPSRDRDSPGQGLAFNYGDILHVTNASDSEWWRAKRVMPDGSELGFGIVPSKFRVERRERALRKQVNFGADQGGPHAYSTGSLDHRAGFKRGSRSQLSFSRKFPFMKSKEALNELEDGHERVEDPVLSYELVEQRPLDYTRPVIILGPLKERVNESLVTDAERYSSCVPHTSRPPRPNEVHGRDYFFVSKEQMEHDIRNQMFIEAGQYNNNLYGTSVQSVRQVAAQRKHCVLDVSGNAIRRLQAANLYPIAVFTKPYSWAQMLEWNHHLNEDEAQRQFARAQVQAQEFAEYYTAIVQGNTPEEIVMKVKQIIADQSRPVVWVPSAQQQF